MRSLNLRIVILCSVVRTQSALYLVYVSDSFIQEAVIFYHVCPSKATEMLLAQQHTVLSVSSRAQPFEKWTSVRFLDFTKDLSYSIEHVLWAIIEDINSVPLFVPGFIFSDSVMGPAFKNKQLNPIMLYSASMEKDSRDSETGMRRGIVKKNLS